MRPKLKRKVSFVPKTSHFTPIVHHSELLSEIALAFEELEALRLKDLEKLKQEQAAKQMNISQPTFHRMLLGARAKVADALINNKQIRIHGGSYEIAKTKK